MISLRTFSFVLLVLLFALPVSSDDSARLLTLDHFVSIKSTVPSIAGQPVAIYAREKVMAGALARPVAADRVVLFVHGAGTPAEVAFDVPHQDFSWMAYLARAGYDVFAMDTTGYGRSVRPAAMNDPCNLAKDRQAAFTAHACTPSHSTQLTTIQSDWDDIGGVVDYVRALRHVDTVSLIAWSLGGPRAGGFAARHPDKVRKLVLLAPAYNRNMPSDQPAQTNESAAFNTQSRDEYDANWDRQVGCPNQYDRATSDSVWSEMMASDAVGSTWGTGVRRAPQTLVWGWNAGVVAKSMTPALLVAGAHDKQVAPARVQELFADLGAKEKILVDLACSSHNAMWEANHQLLFRASLEWLRTGTVNGAKEGTVKLGY